MCCYCKNISHNRGIIFFVSVLLMLQVISRGNAVVFSYIHDVEDLLRTQKFVIKTLKYHLPYVEDTKKGALLKYIRRCETEQSIAMQKIEKYFFNPINAYTLVKRLFVDLNTIEDILLRRSSKGIYYKKQSKLRYPTDVDMDAANVAMLHLTIIYKLNVSELANGTLKGNFNKNRKSLTDYVSPMSSSDCYELAMAAYSFDEYKTAIRWAEEALRKYHDDCGGDCTYTKQSLVKFIEKIYDIQGQIESIMDDYRAKGRETVTMKEIKENLKTQRFSDQSIQKLWEIESSFLCLKETHSYCSSLSCQYKTGPHPFLMLARLKEETLHLEPEVIMYHDAISDEEIFYLKKLALKHFQVIKETVDPSECDGSGHAGCDARYDSKSTIRRAACLDDSFGTPALVTRRAQHITGLFLPAEDTLIIASYGVGGIHNAHIDTPSFMYRNVCAPHISTVLFYLNDVHQGGATIFNFMNLTVFPVKRAALYWKTLRHPSGATNKITLHASCPVLYGYKWIARKFLSTSETPATSNDRFCKLRKLVRI